MAGKFSIPKSEFQKRWATLQQKMAENDLDVLIAHGDEADPSMVRYLSDYWPLFETGGVALGREGDPILLIGPETLTFAQDRGKCDNIMQLLEYRESAEPEYPGVVLDTFKGVIAAASGGTTSGFGASAASDGRRDASRSIVTGSLCDFECRTLGVLTMRFSAVLVSRSSEARLLLYQYRQSGKRGRLRACPTICRAVLKASSFR